ncbi:2-acyl-glycerophospho-ethanolamine acyltransferase [Mesorhizobium sp. M2D.F.Ca.ET.185.01.1.1]|uniref:AMP-binding protein n=1 Tax=unclassified Mesorhizobium TaxID=325217 RepID=UPI000FCCC443|nr:MULTISPECIES: AMP-binding protein [unclassified Mesorhizobium]TGP76896.1 2-acyl-glycerophospho-ethanolamine acyltransferase [bacterium M00.F.Ca.ET.227.01.1.1]TGP84975.1 2-acyl-glycerophospho-ethanolamine acyltransferase [bacterium M00.F.Ca.ET.221.01.1.1]TGP88545.1 2-acyl-glycerophospho-ethanolamine acyltransferase [bacterium M00.F.Ca.ET.222.01.1.1]TGU04653.1 2-acyl-glycerophospho-ethanolamine acyltransferase [bacterium M00.F.Ca.ET.163.01.1.1]TGU30643.1 2-acyl-glycerophospho-ethanolamine acy
MILTLALLAGLVFAWLLIAVIERFRLDLRFTQALLYVPFKLAYRIADDRMRIARSAKAPVIYVVSHQSRIEPALMLSLLPDDTLHILDEASARSPWLEPWRELARTIAFNAEHVFVSRRLVRVLKGKGRLAVYLPDNVEPDVKSFRLFRAITRIAMQADARIVPIFVAGTRDLPVSLTPKEKAPRHWFPRLSVSVLEPMTVAELVARNPDMASNTNALFDRFAEARLYGTNLDRGLFLAMRDAADRVGPSHPIIEDVISGSLSYRKLFIGARVLGRHFEAVTAPGEAVGVLLPNANGVVLTFVGLISAARVAAMINYTAGPASVTAAIRTAVIRTVVSSRAFIEKAGIDDIVAAVEAGGAKMLWLEDVRASVTTLDKLAAALLWRLPLQPQEAGKPAVILFTSGSEGSPKAVVLSNRNLLANVMQAEARVSVSPADILLNVLPVFHSFGLTGGTILPLVLGIKLFLYPSPLHYKIIPEIARKVKPTVMFGTDTFLANYARTAKDGDFSSLRFVVAGAEAVKQETRRTYRDRFQASIVEGFGLTEAAPVVAVNTAIHSRDGTVGRPLPAIRMKLEPVEGIAEGGRLWLDGPNMMMGYMSADRPGELQPLEGWHDTGDIVSIDREGFITIRGRAKRFAKIAGEMVSLGAVEMLVQSLWPEERHAAVAVPDKRRGERIVLVTTADDASAEELRQFGKKAGAAELMVPNDIIKVDEIPVLGSGKTDYTSARKLAIDRLGLDVAA